MNIHQTIKKLSLLIFINISGIATAEEELIEAEGRIIDITEYKGPEIEKTENKSKEARTEYFKTSLKKLIRFNEDKVIFSTDRHYGVKTDNGRTNDFILGVNGKFKSAPDNHSHTDYQLVHIGDKSVTIHYKSEFDHRSFGKNKISIDEGTFEVDYKE